MFSGVFSILNVLLVFDGVFNSFMKLFWRFLRGVLPCVSMGGFFFFWGGP